MKSKIVIVHSDKHIRKALEALCSVHHEPIAVRDVKSGLKMILKISPALAVVGLDSQKKEALQLLRYMKSYGSTVPVIVVASRGAGALQMQAMKAGAIDRNDEAMQYTGAPAFQSLPCEMAAAEAGNTLQAINERRSNFNRIGN